MKNEKFTVTNRSAPFFRGKKGMDLPVNIVVMLIIGLIIFGLGMSLFSKISGSAESELADLNNQIKNDIASLQCQGDDWLCSSSNVIKNGGKDTFMLYVANRGDETAKFSVSFNLNSDGMIEKAGCGSIAISYPNIDSNILSGQSGSFPFIVRASRVNKVPCSFVTTATLSEGGVETSFKTPVIIRVE